MFKATLILIGIFLYKVLHRIRHPFGGPKVKKSTDSWERPSRDISWPHVLTVALVVGVLLTLLVGLAGNINHGDVDYYFCKVIEFSDCKL